MNGGAWPAHKPIESLKGINPLIAPDGSFLVFSAELAGQLGENDLYIARRGPGATWSPPQHLGTTVNTPRAEFAPGLSPDGRYLFFTSERPGVVPAPTEGRPPGDIYQIELSALPAAPGSTQH